MDGRDMESVQGCTNCTLYQQVKGVLFKQWGDVRKVQAGWKLDGDTYDGFPERPQNPVPDLEFWRNILKRLQAALV